MLDGIHFADRPNCFSKQFGGNMKSIDLKKSLILLVACAAVLQGCVAQVYYTPGWHGGPYGHWYRGGYHRGPWMPADGSVGRSNDVEMASAISRDFGISYDSAEKITKICQSRDLTRDMRKMGLDARDFEALAKAEMPSNEVILSVARALNEDSRRIYSIFASFVRDMKVSN